jgi:hypothetical protein
MATLADILSKKWPGASWSLYGDDYNKLTWYPENTLPKPTEAEIRAFDTEVSLELRWDVVREKRNTLLSECDWTQLNDCPLTSEQVSAWAIYRQSLRAVPQQGVEPEQVVWPSKP